MSTRWDLVVIGGGHNGLTAATAVARAGRSVLVLERRPEIGGLAASEEFHPGYRSAGVLHDTATVRQWVVDELELEKHGLKRRAAPPVWLPERAGEGLLLEAENVEGVSEGESRRYRDFRGFVDRIAPLLRRLTDRPPPELLDAGPRDLLSLGMTGLALRRLGRRTMSELLRVAPTCVADWLDESFENERLEAGLAAPAIWASHTGPRSPGTTGNLLLAMATATRPVSGGSPALVAALERAARAVGVEIRTANEVDSVLIADDRVSGVRLAAGEEIAARQVAAACDPKQVFLRLVPPPARSRGLTRDMVNFRARGTSAKVDLALSGYPEPAGRPGQRIEAIRTGETLDELERAADAVKYRRFSQRPLLEIRVPTLETPELAPAGHHVFSILVHFAPRELDGGWTDESREELGDRVLDVLADHAPDVRRLLVARRTSTPLDLEDRYRLTGGHLYHGEHALDQLVVRPTPQCARYETPIAGLFLCGAGSHPGGGLSGAPGALAAKAILRAGPS